MNNPVLWGCLGLGALFFIWDIIPKGGRSLDKLIRAYLNSPDVEENRKSTLKTALTDVVNHQSRSLIEDLQDEQK